MTAFTTWQLLKNNNTKTWQKLTCGVLSLYMSGHVNFDPVALISLKLDAQSICFPGGKGTAIYKLHMYVCMLRNRIWFLKFSVLKDGASFCYCAYVPRISGYSGFLIRNLPTNTTIFLRGLWLCRKSRSKKVFFRDNWPLIWKEIAIHSLYFNAFFRIMVA